MCLCREQRFDSSTTHLSRRQCHRQAFHLPPPSAFPCETGNLDTYLQAKATKALKIRGFLFADPECISGLEAHPCELPLAPWPCRGGSGDGSRLFCVPYMGLEDQPFPWPGAGVQRSILVRPCITFVIQHKMQPPLQGA